MLRGRLVLGALICLLCVQPFFEIKVSSVDKSDAATYTQKQRSLEVHKLKVFYMSKDARLWDRLAEYQAQATLSACVKYKLAPSLLAGLVIAESEGYPFAVSSTGARGNGQVDFKAHKDRFPYVTTERDRFDPAVNLDCSANILKEYTTKYGTKGGLQAYNLGETAYRSGKRAYKYVSKVTKFSNEYKKLKVTGVSNAH